MTFGGLLLVVLGAATVAIGVKVKQHSKKLAELEEKKK
jgi:hypothetical protein